MARSSRPRGLLRGSLRKKGRGFEYRFSLNGQSYSFSIRAETIARAVSRANELYSREERRAGLAATGVPTDWRFWDLLEDLKENVFPNLAPSTRATYERTGNLFLEFAKNRLGDPLVQDFRKAHIQRYLDWRRNARQARWGERRFDDRRVSDRTLQKDRTILHALFERSVALEIRESNPVAQTSPIKTRRRIPRLPTLEQIDALIREMRSPMGRLYVSTLVETGGRSESEILQLRWEDVDFKNRRIRVYAPKTKTYRKVPMSWRLVQAYREHFLRFRNARYCGRTSEWVFHHVNNQRRAKAGDRIKSMRRSVREAAKRAGLPNDFHVHDLRHWRITRWLAEGKPLPAVQRAVGHSDPRVTSWYTHLLDEDLEILVE